MSASGLFTQPGSKPEVAALRRDVCFTLESGHWTDIPGGPFSARSRHDYCRPTSVESEPNCRSVQRQANLLYKALLLLNLAEGKGTKFRAAEIARLLMKVRDRRGEARLIHRCFE
jgi:hypothetical protein